MRVITRIGLLTATSAVLAIPALPAAASTAPLPETVLRVKSVDWQPRTGAVAVTARVKCTGEGSFRWQAQLDQGNVRARNSSNVPCDGDGYLSTLVLDPKQGRFHPGSAELGIGGLVTGDGVGAGWLTVEQLRLSPR
jgi:hypothetical protein